MHGPAVAEPEGTPEANMLPPVAPPHFLTRADLVRTWARAAAIGTACLVIVFAAYELIERTVFRGRMPTQTLFLLHMVRGVTASVLVGTLSVLVVWWVRSRYEAAFAAAHHELERAMERRIAESKRLEAHVRHQEKMAALGVLSAGIAHDIANPLASMSSELEMLEDETDLAHVRASLAELRRQVSRIDRTLREMTAFARRRGEEVVSLPLSVAVDDAMRMARHDPRGRKVRFEVDVPRDLPPVDAVEDHVVMVLVNLIINALDAMPDGGELRITGAARDGGVVISVRDTGCGMTEDVRQKATLPLFTTKEGGTGLGLSVSAGVMEAAGGSLAIDSAPGRGTEVTLRFPRSKAKPPRAPSPAQPSPAQPSPAQEVARA
jgi:signal transduction histidine kinase